MTNTGTITHVLPVAGGWHTKVDGALPLAIVRDEWNRPDPPRIGDRVRYRHEAAEFIGLLEKAPTT